MIKIKETIPGILIALIIAAIAYVLGYYLPIVGASIFGLVLGMLAGNIIKKPAASAPGIKFSSKKILQLSIILIGAGIDIHEIYQTGLSSIYIMLFTISAAFFTVYILKRIFNTSDILTALIGTGTAICGGSAIAALSPVIDADEKDIAYSISVVFLFNAIAVLIFPVIGHLVNMSDTGFGLFTGTAINDTSAVIAASYSYSKAAGDYGIIVKLTRTLMIVPITLIYAFIVLRQKKKDSISSEMHYNLAKIFPWFILGFLFFALINSFHIFPESVFKFIAKTGKIGIIIALSAIGYNADFRKIVKTGFKPMLLGLIVWIVVSIVSYTVQYLSNGL